MILVDIIFYGWNDNIYCHICPASKATSTEQCSVEQKLRFRHIHYLFGIVEGQFGELTRHVI